MIETLPSAPDVIALRVRGRLGRADLDPLIGRMEASLAERPKTHIFVEVASFGGFDLSDLPHYLGRSLGLLKSLDRFGRIAVVSEETWLLWATRFESAILPHVSYRTFRPDRAEAARAWVETGVESL
jgi:SpoIIAA-like